MLVTIGACLAGTAALATASRVVRRHRPPSLPPDPARTTSYVVEGDNLKRVGGGIVGVVLTDIVVEDRVPAPPPTTRLLRRERRCACGHPEGAHWPDPERAAERCTAVGCGCSRAAPAVVELRERRRTVRVLPPARPRAKHRSALRAG